MNTYLENLQWRYATKIFDTSKKVSSEDLQEIMEAFRLSASSLGLQPWKLLIIENQELKNQIMEGARNQTHIGNNSHLLVFTKPTTITTNLAERHLNTTSTVTGASREQLAGYESMLYQFISGLSETEADTWAREQVFLALGNVLGFLASKRIDACPVGGFDKQKINEVLQLKEKGLESVVLLPIGYRNPEDKYATTPKVRYAVEEVCKIIS